MENDGKSWKIMENDGKWWKMLSLLPLNLWVSLSGFYSKLIHYTIVQWDALNQINSLKLPEGFFRKLLTCAVKTQPTVICSPMFSPHFKTTERFWIQTPHDVLNEGLCAWCLGSSRRRGFKRLKLRQTLGCWSSWWRSIVDRLRIYITIWRCIAIYVSCTFSELSIFHPRSSKYSNHM